MPTIYLEDHRRETAQFGPKFQHFIASVPLLMTGWAHLSEGVDRPIALLEIGIALIVLGTFIKEVRAALRARQHGHSGHSAFGWFDLAAGGMLIFEAFHSPHTKPAFMRPQFLSGVVTIGLGVFHPRLHAFHRRRRYLALDESGVQFRLGPFRRLNLRWSEISGIEVDGAKAVFHRTNGPPKVMNLARFRNADEVRKALSDCAATQSLSKSP